MPKRPDRPYKIIFLGDQGSVLRALGERAAERGVFDAYAVAVKSIQHRLTTDPLVWGDPQNHLPHLQLLLCHGTRVPLHVYFAVDEQRRIVYVRDIKPFPSCGLDDAP